MSPTLPKTYKAVVVESANADLVIKDVPLEQPKTGEVLVKVLACGVCHSDADAKQGLFHNPFPIVLGHEMVGDIVAVPDTEDHWKVGDRVGGPWHGGHCAMCTQCKRGLFQMCEQEAINGVTRNGGYAEYVVLRREATVHLPTDIEPAQCAPLLCAGVTVYNGLRQLRLFPGSVVAVQGLGGLGHLALQYAAKMGFKVVALSSGSSKKDFATKLGASVYVDSSSEDPLEALQKLGGAACVICTAPNPKAIGPMVGGLAPGGTVLVISPCGEISVDTSKLILPGCSIKGWPSGASLDSEEAVAFAMDKGVECMIEKFPLSNVKEAFEHMTSGKVRFRSVLVME